MQSTSYWKPIVTALAIRAILILAFGAITTLLGLVVAIIHMAIVAPDRVDLLGHPAIITATLGVTGSIGSLLYTICSRQPRGKDDERARDSVNTSVPIDALASVVLGIIAIVLGIVTDLSIELVGSLFIHMTVILLMGAIGSVYIDHDIIVGSKVVVAVDEGVADPPQVNVEA